MVSRSLYLQREAAGLCVRCGNSRGPSATKQCQSCVINAKIKREDKKSKRLNNKLCILCGVKPIENLDKYCNSCHQKKKDIDKKVYQSKINNNICIKCKIPSKTTYCKDCSKKQLEQTLKHSEGLKTVIFSLYKSKCNMCGQKEKNSLLLVSSNPAAKPPKEQGLKLLKTIAEQTKITGSPPNAYTLLCQLCYRKRSIEIITKQKNLINADQELPLIEDSDLTL